ncbi:MAG: histidine kinase, partial [Spirochaetota bacterium]
MPGSRQRSYITRLFIALAAIIIVVALLMTLGIASQSYRTIEEVIIHASAAMLKKAAESSSRELNILMNLCSETSWDNTLINLLYTYRKQLQATEEESVFPAETIREYLQHRINSEAWISYPASRFVELHILAGESVPVLTDLSMMEAAGNKSATYLTVSPRGSSSEILERVIVLDSADAVLNQGTMAASARHTTAPVLLPTARNDGRRGIEQYSFQILLPIKDYISGTDYGVLVANVSEKLLYDTYKDMQSKGQQFFMVDPAGIIISAQDKTLIGTKSFENMISTGGTRESGMIRDQPGSTLIFYQRLGSTSWYLLQRADTRVALSAIRKMSLGIGLVTLSGLFAIMLVLRYFQHKVAQPIAAMNVMMASVAQGDLGVRADVVSEDEFGSMARAFNIMVSELAKLLDAVRDSERKKRLAELDFLQAQINPHFLHNTLSSIRFSLEMGKHAQAQDLLFHFSRLIRSTLAQSSQFVPLRQELASISDYVELQKIRYKDRFSMTLSIDENTLDCRIPSFILQPVVEN